MIKCNECKQCNRIHKPGVMRFSAYCDSNRIDNKILRLSIFEKFKNRIKEILYQPLTNTYKKKGGFRF